jgi:hypothetical protein
LKQNIVLKETGQDKKKNKAGKGMVRTRAE